MQPDESEDTVEQDEPKDATGVSELDQAAIKDKPAFVYAGMIPAGSGTTSKTKALKSGPSRVTHPPFRLPIWLKVMFEAKAGDIEILMALHQRVLAKQSDLHEAHRVVSLLGRTANGSQLLQEAGTAEVVAQLRRDALAKQAQKA